MDAIDRRLLAALQRDAEINRTGLAREVGLSPAGLHKRLARLKQQGYLQRTVALLDRRSLGLDLLCFLLVTFRANLRFENQDELRRAVADLPHVLECYTLTGTSDAILKVAVRDHGELRDLLQILGQAQNVIDRVQTCVALEEVKVGSELPLPAADG
ncbi:Lrp/AsnC family transcriptional regulator [Deinococcus sp. SM5_A1]|uniref:Lrp/AsnC family transcriptional regulator n=1 Tax=Deinococcus sp. SM5_A1 TaxID=3379094 RepID=UPI00385FA78C